MFINEWEKAEQRYSTSIQQGQCLDNATQMGQDELSILTRYVTPSAVIVFRPSACGRWELCCCITLPLFISSIGCSCQGNCTVTGRL